jgi:ABC-type nitrate/sulfonate/bicarbonate transport system substrate-binding protein
MLTTSEKIFEHNRKLVNAVISATRRGYAFAEKKPEAALNDLLAADKSLNRADQEAQMKALLPVMKPKPLGRLVIEEWASWDFQHELLEDPLAVEQAFSQTR